MERAGKVIFISHIKGFGVRQVENESSLTLRNKRVGCEHGYCTCKIKLPVTNTSLLLHYAVYKYLIINARMIMVLNIIMILIMNLIMPFSNHDQTLHSIMAS